MISDYGAVPQLREVHGRHRYLESVLSKQLREEGEAVLGNVVITDAKSPVDERCSMVLYQVLERGHYARYVSAVDASTEACLLYSMSRLFGIAASNHKRGCTLLLFAHHEVLDLVAVEAGSVVGFRRMAGMFNGEFRSERLGDLTDQVNSLNQQLRNGFERIAAYQWLFSSAEQQPAWVRSVSEHLQLNSQPVAAVEVSVDGAECRSHWLPLIDRLGFRSTSAPNRNRRLAAAVALMPLIALGLFLANAGLFFTYATATLTARTLDADIMTLNHELQTMRSEQQVTVADFRPVLDNLEKIREARRLPGYEQVLGELYPLLNSELVVQVDGVRMTYPREPNYRRSTALGRDAVATATGEGILIEVAGNFLGDAMAVMDTFDELSRRLGGASYRLLDSEVNAGASSTDFLLILERLPNEE